MAGRPVTLAERFYITAKLVELQPTYVGISQNLERYKKLKAMEADGSLLDDAHQAEFEEAVALESQFADYQKAYEQWSRETVDFLNMPLADMEQIIGSIGKNKKKTSDVPSNKDSFSPEQIKQKFDAVLGAGLWNGGDNGANLANAYLRALIKYVSAPEAARSEAFDDFVRDRIERLNQDLPRRGDCKSAQSIFWAELKKINDNDSRQYDDIVQKYCQNMPMAQANTKMADNQLFRCLASGKFYTKDEANGYSAYFIKNYGSKYNVSSRKRGIEPKNDEFYDAHDILKMIEKSYGEATATRVRSQLLDAGIKEDEFSMLNTYDVCRIMQKDGALSQGRSFRSIDAGCPDSPYGRYARMLGRLLTVGQQYLQIKGKCGNNQSDLKRSIGQTIFKTDEYTNFETVYNKHFKPFYGSFESFLEAGEKAFKYLQKDFANNKMSDYFDKWLPALCQGNIKPSFDDVKSPFEINIHHKVPVKIAKLMKNPLEINDISNFCLFVEFVAPTGEKLTKHQQEHNKESGNVAAVGQEVDHRFVVTSGGTMLAYELGAEPAGLSELRRRVSSRAAAPKGAELAKAGEGR